MTELPLPKPVENEWQETLNEMLKVLKSLRHLSLASNWTLCLNALYSTTKYIEKYPIRIDTVVPAGGSFTYEVNLVGSEWCCLCYWCKFAAKLENDVILTVYVNEEPVDVPDEWRNKTPFVEEPCPPNVPEQPRYYIEIPKRKFRVYVENENTSTDSSFVFYTNYDRTNYEEIGLPLAKWWSEDVSECIEEILIGEKK